MIVLPVPCAAVRETRGVAQAGVIGDGEVGGRLGLYRLHEMYDRRNK